MQAADVTPAPAQPKEETMSARLLCRRCSTPLSRQAERTGTCPRCLLARVLAPPPDESAPPPNFGDYEIGAVVGRGGMGVVRRARQRSLDREVALKFLPFELLESEDFLERFEREARLMARLTHPGIARVFETGISPAGQAFLAMEFIQGEPLTSHLRASALPWRLPERLGLFLQVCEAVQHAHQRGIIHRDLKPSNVLAFGTDEGTRIKVIDFGLARPEGELGADATIWRSQNAMVGTPLYMSPEQAAGGEVDTRTDVHALGSLLYELLAGEPPWTETGLDLAGTDRAGIARRLRETPLHPPSELLAGASPARAAELRGDLDAICLRALATEPADRYASVGDLAEDIRRHLADEPVRARPATATYRLGKFLRRHRWLIAVSALVMTGLAAAAIFSALQARAARKQRDRAERVKSVLMELLGTPSPGVDGRNVRVIDVLARARERAEREFEADPAVLADLRLTLGRTYYDLSLYAEAEPLLRAALADARRIHGADSLPAAAALKALAELCNWTSRQSEGEFLIKEAVGILRAHLPQTAAALGRALQSYASIHLHSARPAEAVPLLEESIRAAELSVGAESGDALVAAGDLALALHRLGRTAEARPMFERVVAGMRRNPSLRENLATMLSSYGEFLLPLDAVAAVAAHREALERRRELYGKDAQPVALSQGRLAWAQVQCGQMAEAEANARAALEIQRKLEPPLARDLAFSLRPLASVLLRTGRAAEAGPLLLELQQVAQRHLPADRRLHELIEAGLAEVRAAAPAEK